MQLPLESPDLQPAASRSDAVPVAVPLQPMDSVAKSTPRRGVVTAEQVRATLPVVLYCSSQMTELTYI